MPSHALLLAALLLLGTELAASLLPAGATEALPPPSGSGGGKECERRCGDVDVPYPFGIGPASCAMTPKFLLQCNDTRDDIRKLFRGNVEVLNISLQLGQARVMNFISSYCYDVKSRQMVPNVWHWNLTGSPYMFSDTANKFTVLGCRTVAYIGDNTDNLDTYTTGCVAMRRRRSLNRRTNGSCSGMGCCQTAIPRGLRYYQVWFDQRLNTSEFNIACPCSYAVLMESSNFTFSTSYLTSREFNDFNAGRMPLVLDWVVGSKPCNVARTEPGYACVSSNSECVDVSGGYICNCTKGFYGNPYLTDPDGCQDIDECKDNRTYPCYGICNNKPGTYDCLCPEGTQGNASIAECHKQSLALDLGARLAIGISAGVFVGVIAFLGTKVVLHKRSMKRQALFQQHGGQLLKRMLKVEGNDTFTIYDRGDIMKATRNFHKENIVGEGAHGTVYQAILPVGGTATNVAVKRCKEVDDSRKKEFVQELVILCHLNHPNIVRLLGCCLDFEAPMLVYEFLQNRNLNHLLHGRPRHRLTLATRLRIAVESAEALAHLHSLPHPVLHGDVKPENILLANDLIAKVSDFGCSTIKDNIQVVPKGTLAYLDPEFLLDSQLTDKSDVYSFGVVLIELLTGKKPRSKEAQNLTLMFQESMGRGTIGELLDTDIVEESSMVVIQQAAELGCRCLAVPGTARPSMKQVAQELGQLKDQVAECSQLPQVLEDLGPTEIEMSTGYPTAQSQSEAASGTYMG